MSTHARPCGVRDRATKRTRLAPRSPNLEFLCVSVRQWQNYWATHTPTRSSTSTGEKIIVHSYKGRYGILDFSIRQLAAILIILAAFASPVFAAPKNETFKIPPVKIPLKIKDQQITIVASGLVTMAPKVHGLNVVNLALTADLADLQQNLTPLLAAALDKDNHCSDRIQIQNATITPVEPASLVVVQLHYERWACVKLFGKEQVQKLIGGNAVIQVKLTPSVGENHTQLLLTPELGPIQADGTLGELLRAGDVGEILRDKIQDAILTAMQKGLDLSAILPPALQGDVTIQDAQFKDAGNGRLIVTLDGVVQITDDQLQDLEKQLKSRLPFH